MDSASFWQSVKTNLQAGRIRMIFLADRIPDELRRIVEFLNEQMDPSEVLAVEIRQFEGTGIRTLVPRVYGLTAEAESRKGTNPKGTRWDEGRFFEALREKTAQGRGFIKALLDWSISNTDRIDWGSGLATGSFTPIITKPEGYYPLFSMYSNGTFEIPFQYLKTRSAFNSEESRQALWERYRTIPGMNLQKPSLDKRPWFDCTTLPEEALPALQEVIGWCIATIRNA